MLSPLNAVVLVQFLEGPLLPLSATKGFVEGEILLKNKTADYYFHFLELQNVFLLIGQLRPPFQ